MKKIIILISFLFAMMGLTSCVEDNVTSSYYSVPNYQTDMTGYNSAYQPKHNGQNQVMASNQNANTTYVNQTYSNTTNNNPQTQSYTSSNTSSVAGGYY